MENSELAVTVDLRGKVPPIRSKQGCFEFLEALSWTEASQFMLVRYARDGVPQESGVRIDLGKRAILDNFSDAKNMTGANTSLRKHRAPQIWDAIVEGLREIKLEAAADKLYSIGHHHGWWGNNAKPSWRELDPIGREEFLDVTASVITAYNGPDQPISKRDLQHGKVPKAGL